MPNLRKRWQIAPVISPDADRVLQDYPPVLRQILYNRGYTTSEAARRYLEAWPPEDTDPSHMLGISQAVDRIIWSIRKDEPIAIYGDYDVDGVTATALLVQLLEGLGARVIGYIPNRFDEGYGLNNEALNTLHEQGIRLVVTVDCGIRSLAEVEYARNMGLEILISDHHHPGAELPRATAIINPKQPGDPYPDKDLAGVGLAYKIANSLVRHLNASRLDPDQSSGVERWLDLVALGTVADMAPLVGENRALVRQGLLLLRQTRRQGLRSLIGVSGLQPYRLSATDIGFVLGPRLNAAGRLDSALDAYRLLSTQDIQEAGHLAQKLDSQNRERQQITRQIQAAAEVIALANDPDPILLFAAHPDFNPGVVGLAATRLTEQYYRPAIIAHIGETHTRGSCRSIPEFHITQALDQCEDLLVRHGGHASAAGFTVQNDRLPELYRRLLSITSDQLRGYDLRPTIVADGEVTFTDLHPELLTHLDALQPTGYGNSEAFLLARRLKVVRYHSVGKENQHLKLLVTDGWYSFDAIAFRQGHWVDQIPPYIDMIFTYELNEYNGRQNLQLNVRDLRPSGSSD